MVCFGIPKLHLTPYCVSECAVSPLLAEEVQSECENVIFGMFLYYLSPSCGNLVWLVSSSECSRCWPLQRTQRRRRSHSSGHSLCDWQTDEKDCQTGRKSTDRSRQCTRTRRTQQQQRGLSRYFSSQCFTQDESVVGLFLVPLLHSFCRLLLWRLLLWASWCSTPALMTPIIWLGRTRQITSGLWLQKFREFVWRNVSDSS